VKKTIKVLLVRSKACGLQLQFPLIAVFCGLLINSCAMTQSGGVASIGRFEFGVIGDQQYTAEDERKFPNLIGALNDANPVFVVHVGDFQGDYNGYKEGDGNPPCTDQTMAHLRNMFQTSRHPFIVTPGDNDWTDCHKRKVNPFDPLDRLAKVREVFFPSDQSLGQRTIALSQQSKDSKYSKYRENARWTYGDILFVTLHTVGSNNNLGRTREMDAEYSERNAANLAWMKEAFDLAKRNGNKGMVLLTQANFEFETFWAPRRLGQYMRGFRGELENRKPEQLAEIRKKSGYADMVRMLEAEVLNFGKPVLFVHGDTHVFRVDKPLFNIKNRRTFENFTRVEVFGSPDVHWVRIVVDSNNPGLFIIRPEIVEGNLVNHAVK
jgi:Calcineurin-like phosphoesterase